LSTLADAAAPAAQVRLYALAEALGEPCCDEAGDEDDVGCLVLPGEGVRRSLYAAGPDKDDGEEGGVEPDLMVTVQRMPSKVSAMAWAPFLVSRPAWRAVRVAPRSVPACCACCAHAGPARRAARAVSVPQDGVLTVGDYDGVLLQLHLASGHQLADVDAHEGRKIWWVSVSRSRAACMAARSRAASRCQRHVRACADWRVPPRPRPASSGVQSAGTPHQHASAADDRTARLWDARALATATAVLQPNPRAAVTCVDFAPEDERLLALACSDRCAYVYDTRALARGPLAVLRGHARPASYVRFLSDTALVTAATDATAALWDLRAALAAEGEGWLGGGAPPSPFLAVQGGGAALLRGGSPSPATPLRGATPPPPASSLAHASCAAPTRLFRGHRNEKNFVGLSVRRGDGLLACGSECSRAFAYHPSWTAPLATLDVAGPRSARGFAVDATAGFVSAVCWQPADAGHALGLPPLLASASSRGAVSLSALLAVPGRE
jgi:E3 ubiquitin-protein ligase RFWD2